MRSFAAQVKGQAQTSAFSKQCSPTGFTQDLDYTEDIVKPVLLGGIVNENIKRHVLGLEGVDLKSLNDSILLETPVCGL